LEALNGIHPERCIASPDASRPSAWRVRVPRESIAFVDLNQGPQRQNLRDDVGDFVVLRTEGWFAYQLAVVVDDAEQRISEIVRGSDLLDSTPRQIYLQRRLEYPTPRYLHMPLVLDEDGRKLSKQDRARPVDRTDPVAALRMALEFLGIETGGVSPQIDRLLAAAVTQFDVTNVRFVDSDF
jgi:glutamyl-Q tRNA(Asp) synthetase